MELPLGIDEQHGQDEFSDQIVESGFFTNERYFIVNTYIILSQRNCDTLQVSDVNKSPTYPTLLNIWSKMEPIFGAVVVATIRS